MSAPNIAGAPLPQRARGFWKAQLSAAFAAVERVLEAERAQLPPWLVIGFGSGIAGWFALGEPRQWAALIAIALALAVLGFLLLAGRVGRALGWFALAAALGCALVWARSVSVAAPRLDWPKVVSVTGRIEQVDLLTAKGQVRLTIAPDSKDLPPRIRVSFDQDGAPAGLAPGSQVSLRARLAPPPPMALPGTYDFARDAWFKGIGAVGKALGPVTVTRAERPRGFAWARDGLRQHIQAVMPAGTAGIAVALVTGDQNAVGKEDADAMRRSGLTHLLSVSGLHIAAVVAAAMFLTLKLLALSRTLALRLNLVMVAAGAAAAAGIGYTLLTGAQVPTVRSCVAALLILAGIALGRESLSMRLIAVGALLVLLFRPEALAGASFQMSFAAVTAIVALHSTRWAREVFARREEGALARLLRAGGGLFMTGLAVEVALIPLALFHFHRAGLYGVAANIIAIPLTTFVIMPLEGGALLLDVAGIGAPLWTLCSWSIAALLGLAHWVAAAKGSVALIPGMPVAAYTLMVGGGLWLCLWVTPIRRLGLFPIIIGAMIAGAAPRPDLLVTGDGKHAAIIDRDGTPLLLRDRSGDYVRSLVSEASGFDGDEGTIDTARFGSCTRDSCIADIERDGRRWRLLAMRSPDVLEWQALIANCAAADIVIADRRLPAACKPRWLKLDRTMLQRTGGLALTLRQRPLVSSVEQWVGDHPWGTFAQPQRRQYRRMMPASRP
ncbi:MAG: ComEC/Rec2 family competence protein [Pseudomonadota bacterium]|nr:ComEC/Rec2 family competence protein [Pseudomonadota bacterium]